MGLDIYLGGYEAFEKRTAGLRQEFNAAVKERDEINPRINKKKTAKSKAATQEQKDAAQEKVKEAYDKLFAPENGYLRSSYNSAGLFVVLREIFGFDVAEFLFPGNWDSETFGIDAEEFRENVVRLEQTVITALSEKRVELPWLDVFERLNGKGSAPTKRSQILDGEKVGQLVFDLIKKANEGDKGAFPVDVSGVTLEPEQGPLDHTPRTKFTQDHVWYVMDGIIGLHKFADLAVEIARETGKDKVRTRMSY